MKLTYRGVQYSEEQNSLAALRETTKKEIIYRGNSPKGKINPRFPWLKYIKQLFYKSESRPIIDPITFWYNHKREFIEDCWRLDDIEQLDRAWNLTLQLQTAQGSRSKKQIKLKYRGVTYYR